MIPKSGCRLPEKNMLRKIKAEWQVEVYQQSEHSRSVAPARRQCY
jgi:hypothetical protein